jgi:Holliday junction resolvasome RuvABC endonuclease subunit
MRWPEKRKPIVLGLDVSKHCGWAIWETWRDPAAISYPDRCGVFEFDSAWSIEYCADQMYLKLYGLLKSFSDAHPPTKDEPDGRRVDFCVMETALKMSPNKDAASIVSSCMLHGAALAALSRCAIPWATIYPSQWRKAVFGKGYKPAPKVVTDRITGMKKLGEADWKGAIVSRIEEYYGVVLPPRKSDAHNAAEAVAVAMSYHRAEIHAKRYEPALLALRKQRNNRDGGDLFGSAA